MQAVSIQYNHNNKWSTLILLYNPCKNIPLEEFSHYLDQVEGEGLVYGDLNARHPSWESSAQQPNTSGKNLQEALNQNTNLFLLNPPDLPTRMDPNTGKTSNLDLIISTASDLNKQKLLREDFGSDHSMVILAAQNKNKTRLQFRHKWSIRKE